MLSKFDLKANFWDLYPQFKIGFKELYHKDKSIRRKDSSRIMWALALLIHPGSEYASIPEDKRKEIIEKDWLEKTNFKWESVKKEITMFTELCLTKKERYLRAWALKLDERDKMLESIPYNEDTAEWLDKLMVLTTRLQEAYDKAEEEFYKEKTATSGQGGAEESLRERLKA